jgi:hypothetical protein
MQSQSIGKTLSGSAKKVSIDISKLLMGPLRDDQFTTVNCCRDCDDLHADFVDNRYSARKPVYGPQKYDTTLPSKKTNYLNHGWK